MPIASKRYFHHVRTHVRPNGERFPTVFEDSGVLAHYPTCLMLNLRARSVASATLKAMTYDLIHLGQVLEFEGISDLNERLEDGRYLDDSEIEVICEGMGLQTSLLRRLNDPKVSPMKRTSILQNAPAVANDTKHRRITTCVQYIDLVARIGEAQAKAHQRRERAARRLDMVEFFKSSRPTGRSSRVRNAVRADDLAKIISFVATGDPSAVWKTPHLRDRNWAIVTLLTLCGLRQSELRQLRADDIDTNQCTVAVHRRPDDPEDPRVDEPNAKTADRIIPISHEVADRLDVYLLGCGQDGALMSGSPFAFLSAGNNSYGRPISSWVIEAVVRQLGNYLGVQRLHPHALRSAWVQHLADWASSKGIEPAELDRLANYLGGWSYFSKSASRYRGDHLTQKAFEAGIIVEEAR